MSLGSSGLIYEPILGFRCQKMDDGWQMTEVGSRNAEVGIGKKLEGGTIGHWAKRLEHSVLRKAESDLSGQSK
jgi:hypothetical protein